MANVIKLSSDVPVASPNDEITVTAKVTSEDGSAASGIKVFWSLGEGESLAEFDGGTSDDSGTSTSTSDTGYTSIKVKSTSGAVDLTITATTDEGDNSPSDSFSIGFYSTNLKAPEVPQADSDGTIDELAIKLGVQVMVPEHTDDPQSSDKYTFYWGSDSIARYAAAGMPWIFNLTDVYQPSEVLSDGNYIVYYTVTDTAGNVVYSQPLFITVTGGTYVNPLYDAPEFPDAPDNTVNSDLVLEHDGLVVDIPYPQATSPGLYAGDVISLYMRVYDSDYSTDIVSTTLIFTYTITSEDISNGEIKFTIPSTVITDDKDTFDDVRGEFWYMVSGEGSVAVSGTSSSKRLIIDTVPPH